MNAVMGIDPGAGGALALLTDGGDLLDACHMPIVKVDGKPRISAPELARIVRTWKPALAVIERVGAMPGQGVSSMFAFGYAAGMAEMACAAAGVPVTFVQPAAWKRGMKVTKDKGSSRLMAQRLWPVKSDLFARVMDEARAEAALIGLFGRAQWQREAA